MQLGEANVPPLFNPTAFVNDIEASNPLEQLKILQGFYSLARFLCCDEEDELARSIRLRMSKVIADKEKELCLELIASQFSVDTILLKVLSELIAKKFAEIFSDEEFLKKLSEDYLIEILSQPIINAASESAIWKKLAQWIALHAKEIKIESHELWLRIIKKQPLVDLIQFEHFDKNNDKEIIGILKDNPWFFDKVDDYNNWKNFFTGNAEPPRNRSIRTLCRIEPTKIEPMLERSGYTYEISIEEYLKLSKDKETLCGRLINIQGINYQLLVGKEFLFEDGKPSRIISLRSSNSSPFEIGITLGDDGEYFSRSERYGKRIAGDHYATGVIYHREEFEKAIAKLNYLKIFIRKV